MRQREGFHTCRRHVFHAQRQLCFHTAACSGTSYLPNELYFANIGILNAQETFSQEKEVYCAMSIGCTAAYAAVTSRRYAAQ